MAKSKAAKQKAEIAAIDALTQRCENLEKALMTLASMLYRHIGDTGYKRMRQLLQELD